MGLFVQSQHCAGLMLTGSTVQGRHAANGRTLPFCTGSAAAGPAENYKSTCQEWPQCLTVMAVVHGRAPVPTVLNAVIAIFL